MKSKLIIKFKDGESIVVKQRDLDRYRSLTNSIFDELIESIEEFDAWINPNQKHIEDDQNGM